MENVFKILTKAEMRDFQATRVFRGTLMDQRDGYIHMCARDDQVQRVLKKYYAGETMVYILRIDANKLDVLKWEEISSGDVYPHQYGVLDFDAVLSYRPHKFIPRLSRLIN